MIVRKRDGAGHSNDSEDASVIMRKAYRPERHLAELLRHSQFEYLQAALAIEICGKARRLLAAAAVQPLIRPARVPLRVVDSQQADNPGVLQDTLHLLLLSEENLGPELGVVDDLADALANRCLQRLNRSNGY